MNVVEIAIQGCPLDIYFGHLVDSGLLFKVIATVLDDNVTRSCDLLKFRKTSLLHRNI
jgi:hypothetical protein